MKRRRFGSTDLEVSEFGFGCARVGGIFQQGGGSFVDLLCAARDAGINFFDTANIYSQGESESLIGRAFRGRRHELVITSKAGFALPGRRKLAAKLKPLLRPIIRRLGLRRDKLSAAVRGSLSQDFSPAHLERALEDSLKRLRTDYLDLFQLHSPPAEIVARGEWEGALERMQRAGKIRHYGISVDSVEAGLAALEYPRVASLQFTVSLLERAKAEALLPPARAKGVGVIARECLANGLLIKPSAEIDFTKYTQSPDEAATKKRQLDLYREEAAQKGQSLPRLALDYARGLDGVSVALIGAKSVDQLRGILRDLP
jgi:aryl-alcohol dehydrogenase-like predicted oxidoreductase